MLCAPCLYTAMMPRLLAQSGYVRTYVVSQVYDVFATSDRLNARSCLERCYSW